MVEWMSEWTNDKKSQPTLCEVRGVPITFSMLVYFASVVFEYVIQHFIHFVSTAIISLNWLSAHHVCTTFFSLLFFHLLSILLTFLCPSQFLHEELFASHNLDMNIFFPNLIGTYGFSYSSSLFCYHSLTCKHNSFIFHFYKPVLIFYNLLHFLSTTMTETDIIPFKFLCLQRRKKKQIWSKNINEFKCTHWSEWILV